MATGCAPVTGTPFKLTGVLMTAVRVSLQQQADFRFEFRFGDAVPILKRALSQFEEFCTVTQSVRQAIPVRVTVVDSEGKILRDQSGGKQCR